MLSKTKIKLLKLMCPVALGLYIGGFFLRRRMDLPDEMRAIPMMLFALVLVLWFFLRRSWLRCPHCHGKLYDCLPAEDVSSFTCKHCRKEIIVQ